MPIKQMTYHARVKLKGGTHTLLVPQTIRETLNIKEGDLMVVTVKKVEE